MTETPALKVRSDLETVAPYVSPQQPAKYRMNVNEAPYPPPLALVEEVTRGTEAMALNRYPDRDAVKLVDAIAAHSGWPAEGLWVANGSNEVFLHLFLACGGPGRSSLTFEPTYSLHTLIPRIAGTTTSALQRNLDFGIDLDAALETVGAEKPDIIILCSPNNPTGACEDLGTIEALLAAAPGLVIVDEAYGEFDQHEHSARPLLSDHPNLVITKTFSKAWRLAGVRIGYMLAAPALIAELARVRLPYHLSAITQLVGVSAIKHADETLEMVRSIAAERDRISTELTTLGLKVFPSHANFVLFEVDDPDRVWRALLDRDVLIRNYPGAPGLERCLRVTAGLPEETDVFVAAMREALDA
jgi:histidinol-phosphate aminotransferase